MLISKEAADCLQPVLDLLTGYMLASPSVHMPGADGLLVEDVLTGYESLAAAGQVPTEAELCVRHPEFASRLTAFFHLTHPPT
jgi:hypothetical protein